jgi:putative addiction module killer protein
MHYDTVNYKILAYINEFNLAPFELWFSTIDEDAAEKVRIIIRRVQAGNFSSCKSLAKGLWEIKLDYGPGIRIYFGKRGDKIILLWGGFKNRQKEDIKRAHKYWTAFIAFGEHAEWH